MTSKRILSITKKIIRKAAEIGLDQAGALIIPGAWPYLKKVISPVVDELQRRYPKMLLVDDEEAITDSEKAIEALSKEKKLQKILEDSFSRLEQGQEEILNEIDRIDEILQSIGTSVDRLSEMTEDGFNQVLEAIKPTGNMAPGNLRIIDIRVTQNKRDKTCFVDFWVSNDGGSQVVITAIEFEVIDTARGELVKGPMKASGSYDLDISELRNTKQIVSCLISQEVLPGRSDRFRVVLTAECLGTGVFAAWVLRPKLITNYGKIEGATVEVWLPFKEVDTTLEEMKKIEAIERGYGGQPEISNEKDSWKDLTSSDNTIAQHCERRNDAVSSAGGNLESNENRRLKISEDQGLSYDDLKKNVDQLINVIHFREFTEYLERLYFDIGRTERFRKFIESEVFGRDIQRRIGDAVGVREIALCLDYIILISIDTARTILSYRGFALSVLPGKLNEEEDIESIGLCLVLLGKCDPILLKLVEESDDFEKKFIQKINNEKDICKVGHTIERISRDSQTFAKKIVESASFDIEGLVEKLKGQGDVEKVNICLGGIQWASPLVAEKVRAALEMIRDKQDLQNL